MCKVGEKCLKDMNAPTIKGGNTIITVDDNLIEYAKRRAKEIMMETQGFVAYSPVPDFIKFEEIKGKKVCVIISQMIKEEARTIFLYRPFSQYAESRFGGNKYANDEYLLMNNQATQCKMCSAPTRNEYLVNGKCPDCDGRSEYNGKDPRK